MSAYEIFLDYGLYGIEPDDSIDYELKLIFSMAKATIDSSRRNIINGSKGGRPKKEDSKTPVKTPVKTKKEKNKEKEMENIPFTYSFKEGDTLSPSADAGEASPFTLTECKECAAKGKVNLTEDGIQAFYNRMEKDGWKIKGTQVKNLLKAMRGFAKNNEQYQIQKAESQKEEQPKKVFKHFKQWLRYYGYDSNYDQGFGEYDEEISIGAEMIEDVWRADDLSESMADINKRLINIGYGKEEIIPLMQLFKKYSRKE